VIDATGAIYVIGGEGYIGIGELQDVWVSTDGGVCVRPDSGVGVGGYTGWVLEGYSRGTDEYSRGTKG
jgi:hypothetical protein